MEKLCSVCGTKKPLVEFVKESRKRDGLSSRCKPCHIKKASPYYSGRTYTTEQLAVRAEYLKAYVDERRGTIEWAAARKLANDAWQARSGYDKASMAREWKQRNKGVVLEQTRYRQTRLLKAVPPWCDREKVREIYELASEFREAGIAVNVDHIVPLNGKTVSGLHWHGNLRVCLASVNMRKGNRLIEA